MKLLPLTAYPLKTMYLRYPTGLALSWRDELPDARLVMRLIALSGDQDMAKEVGMHIPIQRDDDDDDMNIPITIW